MRDQDQGFRIRKAGGTGGLVNPPKIPKNGPKDACIPYCLEDFVESSSIYLLVVPGGKGHLQDSPVVNGAAKEALRWFL